MSKKQTKKVEKKIEKKEIEKEETIFDENYIKILLENYFKETPKRIKMIDCFIVFQLLTAIFVLIYGFFFCHSVLNSFLSALFSCMGMFVFTMSLRLREASGEKENSKKYFVEYVFCVILLQLSVANFLG